MQFCISFSNKKQITPPLVVTKFVFSYKQFYAGLEIAFKRRRETLDQPQNGSEPRS